MITYLVIVVVLSDTATSIKLATNPSSCKERILLTCI